MAGKTLYATLRYDPLQARDTTPSGVYRDLNALRLPTPRKATFVNLNDHSVRFSWLITSPQQEVSIACLFVYLTRITTRVAAQVVRTAIVNAVKKQKTDEELREKMKDRGVYVRPCCISITA